MKNSKVSSTKEMNILSHKKLYLNLFLFGLRFLFILHAKPNSIKAELNNLHFLKGQFHSRN